MILNNKKQDLVSNASNTDTFTIALNGHSFGILTKNLYSEKFSSTVRELCTNAWDSHIQAGTTDIPFEVTIPSSSTKSLIIEDFGTGLDDDEIHRVYTTFFESTKSDTNEATGCLGLGSKTPFAVSDSFFVESISKGIYTKYCLYLNEDMVPSITSITSAPSDRANGMKITIPIKTRDIRSIRVGAAEVLPFFPKDSFIVKNCSYIDTEPIAGQEISDNILLVPKCLYFLQSSKVHFIQGNVRYPVSMKHIEYSTEKLINKLVAYDSALLITVPIGTVNIQPSREELHYDESTIANINHILSSLEFDFLSWCEYSIWNATTLEMYSFMEVISSLGSSAKTLATNGLPQLDKVAKEINRPIYTDHNMSACNGEVIYADRSSVCKDNAGKKLDTMKNILGYIYRDASSKKVINTTYCFSTKQISYRKKLKQLHKDGVLRTKLDRIYVVYGASQSIQEVEADISKEIGHDFEFEYNLDDVTLISETSSSKKNNICKFSLGNWKDQTTDQLQEFDPEKTFYVELYRTSWNLCGQDQISHETTVLRDISSLAGITILGIRKSAKKTIKAMFPPLTWKAVDTAVMAKINMKDTKQVMYRKYLGASNINKRYMKNLLPYMNKTPKAIIMQKIIDRIHSGNFNDTIDVKDYIYLMQVLFGKEIIKELDISAYIRHYSRMEALVNRSFIDLEIISTDVVGRIGNRAPMAPSKIVTLKKVLRCLGF